MEEEESKLEFQKYRSEAYLLLWQTRTYFGGMQRRETE